MENRSCEPRGSVINELGFPISVCHLPPGTSKWNKIERRLFSFIIKNGHVLPSTTEMLASIEFLKRWMRRMIPFDRRRAARLLLHMQHYHDELLHDMGAMSWRKRGALAPFKEVFAPYEPAHYRYLLRELALVEN